MNILLFLVALLPIIWLIVALSVLKLPGYLACLITLVITIVLSLLVWKMPVLNVATATLEGSANALWPIIIVILAALFVYNLSLETKAMDAIKTMLASVSTDKRILMLIIAFGFGNFMEGMAGFGTAVAIPAGILVGLGFNPSLSVVTCLVINSTPTAFGSVGVPINTLANLTNLSALGISGKVVIIQSLVQFIIPFVAVMIIGNGRKALKGILPFTLTASLTFLIPQFLAATFIGPDLADILGSITSMLVMIVMASKMSINNPEFRVEKQNHVSINISSTLRAWAPFILIFVFLLLSSKLVPFIQQPLSQFNSKVKIYSGLNPATLTFYWINTPGVLILVAGMIGGLIQKARFTRIMQVLFETVKSNIKTILTIMSVLSVAKIMGYSGMISTIAQMLVTTTGQFFPLISPLIGTIGGMVTGSGTSTAALFGKLQVETASAIGVNQEWLAAANLMGAGIGKMMSPQGIAIGSAAVGLVNQESKILSKVLKWTIIFVVIAGLFCYILPLLHII